MSFRAQGLRAWLLQRMTAVYIALYLVFILAWLLQQDGMDFNTWQSLFSRLDMVIATILLYVSLLIHAWVGMRDVFLDYVKPQWLRMTMLGLLGVALVVMGIWVLVVMLKTVAM